MRVAVEYRTASRETWKKFCSIHPELNVSYNDFCTIIYSFNYAFRDHMLETGKVDKMAWGFGDFAVSKKKQRRSVTKDGKEIIVMPVNWKMSKLLGKKVYHMNYDTEQFVFKWKWFQDSARIYKTSLWKFKATRIASRLINHYVKQGYADKYQEWDSI